jgi:hypothetical protein
VLKTTFGVRLLNADGTINSSDKFYFVTEKSTNSYVYATAFNLTPTVAYRKNYLGINTTEPAKKGSSSRTAPLVVANATSTNNVIYLTYGTTKEATITLSSSNFGNIDGFVINCGSW